MAKKKYTGTVTLRTARPRSRRLRELGIGGAVTISTTAGGSSSEGGGSLDYASEAGHAAEADHATSADTAQNLAQDSTDWQTIDQKDAEMLESAKQYADGNFLSKTEADSAAGEITFLNGLKLGLQKLWGITKDGVATLANLVTQALRVNGSATVTGTMTSNRVTTNAISTGSLEASGNIGCGGRVDAGGEIHSEEKVSAPLGEFANANVGNTLTTQNLKVTGLAEFLELVIDKLRAAGGAQLYTPADGFKVEAVTRFAHDGGYRRRLWWRATDGVKKSRNMWKAGDQAICMNFNAVDSAGTYQDVSNRWFWAVVAWPDTVTNTTPAWDSTNPEWAAGKPNPYEQTDWHLIDLYCGATADALPDQDADGKDLWTGDIFNVAPGDEVAMLGHRRRGSEDEDELKRRQAAVYLSAYSSYDSELTPPFLAFYRGIDDFTLASHRTTYMDAVGSKFYGDFYASSDREGLAGLLSTLEVGLNGIRAEVKSLHVSRNMLLNAEFLDATNGLPRLWDEWNNTGTAYTRSVHAVPGEKWQRLYIRPTAQYQGIIQTSADVNAATTGEGKYSKDLKHGGYYAMSFYAYRDGSASSRADCIVHFRKVNADGTYSGINPAQASSEFTLTTAWKRYWFAFQVLPTSDIDLEGYGFGVMLGCAHGSVPSNEQLNFSRPQLEEITQAQYEAWVADNSKEIVTAWRRGEETAEAMSSRIEQMAERIDMAVYKDEAEVVGMHMDGANSHLDFVANKTGFFGTDGKEYIKWGVKDGIPYLIFLDGDGNERYNLGYTGLIEIIQNTRPQSWTTLNYIGSDSHHAFFSDGDTIQASELKSITGDACFQYNEAYTLDGQGIPIYSPSGGYRPFYNGNVYRNNTMDASAVPTGQLITAGWRFEVVKRTSETTAGGTTTVTVLYDLFYIGTGTSGGHSYTIKTHVRKVRGEYITTGSMTEDYLYYEDESGLRSDTLVLPTRT